uniref:FAM86 N-terminal domain-containing protein n=1 Tax=Schizophyllum commune (strain H4-8 / FGSC 9210) TaxID=578458 RepID=D8QJR4_SCHCM
MILQTQAPDRLAAPSTRLPAIARISRETPGELSNCVAYLRKIYNPQVRGSSRIRESVLDEVRVKFTADISISDDVEAADELRADAFERSYSLRWLSALVAHLSCLEEVPEKTLDDATSLIALCAGPASAGILTRDFSFPATHPKLAPSIDVRLTDIPLDNHDFHSVGAQTWGGACVLAEAIAEDPASFGFTLDAPRGLRVLELGAGTGLVGIAAGKVVQALGMNDARLVATDFYDSVLQNLASNIRSNFPADGDSGVTFECHRLDWEAFPRETVQPAPLDEPFDVVLGADIVYEAEHATWIKNCLERLLRKPTWPSEHTTPPPTFHLVIPLRPTFDNESSTIESVFPTALQASGSLAIKSKELIMCDAGSGVKGEIVRYAYYRIGWNLS